MYNEYENWVSESMGEFKRTTPEEQRVRDRIKLIKSKKQGLSRQEAFYRMFKEYLGSKATI
jgi:hypothetical protein